MSAAMKVRQAKAFGTQLEDLCVRRATRYLRRTLKLLPRDVIERAVSADCDENSIFEVLKQPETIDVAQAEDPLAEARLRGREIAKRMLAREGGHGTIKTAMKYLDMSKEGVEKRRRKGNLIAIDLGKKGLLYPVWQFKQTGGVLDGLEQVLAKLRERGCTGWSTLAFFLNPHISFDGNETTPLEALQAGRIDEVLGAADMERRHGL